MLSSLLRWFSGARWRLSLSHCLEGLLIQAPVTAITFNAWFGMLAVVVWYWSRKKLEVEISNGADSESHAYTWADGWFPWQWSAYQVLDVVLPALSGFAIAAALDFGGVL